VMGEFLSFLLSPPFFFAIVVLRYSRDAMTVKVMKRLNEETY